ncbi:hypothetical protein YC2023_048760 [Brassica napus]
MEASTDPSSPAFVTARWKRLWLRRRRLKSPGFQAVALSEELSRRDEALRRVDRVESIGWVRRRLFGYELRLKFVVVRDSSGETRRRRPSRGECDACSSDGLRCIHVSGIQSS